MRLNWVGRVARSLAIVVPLSASAATAVAQERSLAIQRGTFVFDGLSGIGTLDVAGTGGLRLNTTMHLPDGNFAAIDLCKTTACAPGVVLDLSAGWGGLGVTGTARFQGKTFNVTGGDLDASLVVAFSGSVTLPPFTGEQVTVAAPFDFAGLFSSDVARVLLTGGGIATLTLVPEGEGLGTWTITQVVFEFRPPGQR
jgi:hypothetical protein